MARLLDLTRLIARADAAARSGVERVEFEYLERLLREQGPLFALVRTTLGYVLLDRAGVARVHDALQRGEWGPRDLLARLSHRTPSRRARAESDLRRWCLARSRPRGLGRMLRRHVPRGVSYINVGHSNLRREVMVALRAGGAQITVLVHDMIPLDFPQFTRAGVAEAFAIRMATVGAFADRIIAVSHDTAARITAHLPDSPPITVAHNGVRIAVPTGGRAPSPRPAFVVLGTIEPRKNHAFLLDLWERMSAPRPILHIIGARGWDMAPFFDRLHASPLFERDIFLWHGLEDAQVAQMLISSRGLLMPSFAEGFGLPPMEAAALGVPVICNDLAIYAETLGDYPVYAPLTDMYLWETKLKNFADLSEADYNASCEARALRNLPDWDDHFARVLPLI
ncbi:Glycosyl transferases group 1 [Aquimixticola soesokkakensis]|uniref:Glycosyl transferases group 1 n=1 Tax=Aquimixticola soesokkakensis TaxID=1519096 RepID=A0A1Y5R7Y2_9RHOB|nr:glycosyltransferase [Aquimixticola soesokkakensis]SLN10589.1 Glycosyl transferases group 1 [Aquimixticola soesokkakensis]